MTVIAADIGGTHARFALVRDGQTDQPEKLECARFPGLTAALAHYCEQKEIKTGGVLLIATAAQPDADGVWRFHNNNRWEINRTAQAAAGWNTALLVNDFYASAHGALSLPDDKIVALKPGVQDDARPRALLGPGTGLGLAYMIPLGGGRWHVQETFGGHMLAASLTEEQALFMRLVQRLRGGGRAVVPEDLASGRALPVLYEAVCVHNGQKILYDTAEEMLDHAGAANVAHALRLFHEFLGLFAHQAVVTGHAYGGLYFDGGIVQRLRERGLFDFSSVEEFMIPAVAPAVRDALEGTPVYIVDDPYVALRGLARIGTQDA